jgi:hypothetical protein
MSVLNDDYHAMRVRMEHDDVAIQRVEAGLMRWPKSTCPDAVRVLDEIIGCPLTVSRRDFYGGGRAGRNCTHLFDLAFWLLGHIQRATEEIVIDIEIPDKARGSTRMRAKVNGLTMHEWQVQDEVIRAPEALAGLGLFAGFAAKVEERLSGLELETARMLQKSAFVAQGREFVVDGPIRINAIDEIARAGACYAFSAPVHSVTVSNIGYVRDFSEELHELLPWDDNKPEIPVDAQAQRTVAREPVCLERLRKPPR